MVNRFRLAVLCGAVVASILAPSMVMAEPAKVRIAMIYSPAKSTLKAKGFMETEGFLPENHDNSGHFYGFLAEIDFGKVSISADYLTGKNDRIDDGEDTSTDPPSETFNPLSRSTVDVGTLALGYGVLDDSPIGELEVTLGYYRLWESKVVTPANWFDGAEIGIKGRYIWDNGFALTYKLGYVPSSSTHGFLKDYDKMTGDDIVNYRIGIEAPVYKDVHIVGGYYESAMRSHVIEDGSTSHVSFSGGYIGAMHSF